MQLCFANRTIRQPHRREAFQFAPVTPPILAIQATAVANTSTRSDGPNRSKLAENLELHRLSLLE
jgi:hypothetical protein